MDDRKTKSNNNSFGSSNGVPWKLNCAFDFFMQVPQRVQSYLKSLENGGKNKLLDRVWPTIEEQSSTWDVNLTKQLQTWKENPSWVDQPPEIKVTVPKGSLCNLSVKFQVGLPPDAIYNIVTDPDNKRVFKNIKEVISRKVLVDEGLRQVVEVEQAALWRFLWWSGTISVHVFVDQNRRNHTVKFKQGKSGFMKKFEGCWTLQPIFIDEESYSPYKSMTLADYDSCTGGKGRVGSIVSLEQLIQPSLVPPPPISWYLRGITTKTTEMLVSDLLAEAARLRSNVDDIITSEKIQKDNFKLDGCPAYYSDDVKERWHHRRRRVRQF